MIVTAMLLGMAKVRPASAAAAEDRGVDAWQRAVRVDQGAAAAGLIEASVWMKYLVVDQADSRPTALTMPRYVRAHAEGAAHGH
ncbi:MAG: hypothetical protein IPM94_13870 [bacterium]|nr:hypothetical protein [bacterium]